MQPWNIVAILGLCLGSLIEQRGAQEASLIGEGIIVGVHTHSRQRVVPKYAHATPVETWVVRIDHWMNAGVKSGYILVPYYVRDQALSDAELDSARLEFTLRYPRPSEKALCELHTLTGKEKPSVRKPVSQDFTRTVPGEQAAFPSVDSLLCLIAEKPPRPIQATLAPSSGCPLSALSLAPSLWWTIPANVAVP